MKGLNCTFPVNTSDSGGTYLYGASQVDVGDGTFTLRPLNLFALYHRLMADPASLECSENGPLLDVIASTSPSTSPATRPSTRPMSLTLTGDPAKIRRHLVDHQDDPELFPGPYVVRRWVPVGQ